MVSIEEDNSALDLTELSDDELEQHVGGLSDLDYGRQRVDIGKELGIDLKTLDRVRNSNREGGIEDTSIADELVELVKDHAELFHTPDERACATITKDNHKENWFLETRKFKKWMSNLYNKQVGRTANTSAIDMAIQTLAGEAEFDCDEHEVWLRCAPHDNGYVIDLCNEEWQVVYVSPGKIEVLAESPVKFYRSSNMLPLPLPAKTGNLQLIWKYMNIPLEDRPLYLAGMLESYRADMHHVVMEYFGGKGSGKSDTQGRSKALIDPNKVPLRALPRSSEDMFVSAFNNYLLSYNNISHLSAPMQDDLCTMATGGGFSKRALYQDMDESANEAMRPVMMNGIPRLASASDLVDRLLYFKLPRINKRIPESALKADFETDSQEIFTGLMQLLAQTLKQLPDTDFDPQRMGDFTHLGEAMSQSFGNAPGKWTTLYVNNRNRAELNTLETTPAALALVAYMRKNPEPIEDITVGALFEKVTPHRTGPSDAWPKAANGFGNALRRCDGALKVMGVVVHIADRAKNDGYHMSVAMQEPKLPELKSEPSEASEPLCGEVFSSPTDISEPSEASEPISAQTSSPRTDTNPLLDDSAGWNTATFDKAALVKGAKVAAAATASVACFPQDVED